MRPMNGFVLPIPTNQATDQPYHLRYSLVIYDDGKFLKNVVTQTSLPLGEAVVDYLEEVQPSGVGKTYESLVPGLDVE